MNHSDNLSLSLPDRNSDSEIKCQTAIKHGDIQEANILRVLEITGEPILHGGQEKFIQNLIENIDHSNLIIDVLTPYYCENDAFVQTVKNGGGTCYELKLPFLPGKSRHSLMTPIYEFLKRNYYDAVHVHSGSTSVLAYGAKAARRAGIKNIVVHSHVTGITSLKQKMVRFVMGNVVAMNATSFLACSYEAGVAKYPDRIVKNKFKVINNGVNIDKYQYDRMKRNLIRNKYNINDNEYVIGHVGRFSEQKNHEYLISLFDEVHKQISNSRLLLVGDGELKQEIVLNVKKMGLEDSVVFAGNVDNAEDYYQAMDVFVLPSKWEGLPFVIVEAQAAGLPCLVSACTPEAACMSSGMKRLSLEDFTSWIDECIGMRDTDREDNSEKIRLAGYDIRVTAKQIRNLYFGKTE